MTKLARVGDSSALSPAPLSFETPQTKLRPCQRKSDLLPVFYSYSNTQCTPNVRRVSKG